MNLLLIAMLVSNILKVLTSLYRVGALLNSHHITRPKIVLHNEAWHVPSINSECPYYFANMCCFSSLCCKKFLIQRKKTRMKTTENSLLLFDAGNMSG